MICLLSYADGFLHPRTAESVLLAEQFDISIVYGRCTEEDSLYRFMNACWTDGLITIEHDIVARYDVFESFMTCESPWCTFPYNIMGPQEIDQGLGCARFSAALVKAEPDAVTVAGDTVRDGVPARHWVRMDTRMADVLHERGYEKCVHRPPVEHLHDYSLGSGPGMRNPMHKTVERL